MKAMVKASGGKYGQNMNDLSFAGEVVKEFPKIKEIPAIMDAIKILEQLAEEDGTIQKAMTTGSKNAIKNKKGAGGQTVRGMAAELDEEKLTKEAIYKIVREAIKG